METYKFLLADADDISEIVSIYNSLIGTPGCTWSLDYPNKETGEDDIENKSLYILQENDKIIAVATARPTQSFHGLADLPWKPKNACEIARIGVIPAMHNKGIGTIMLKNVMQAVQERGFDGIKMLVSKTNPIAMALYDRNGFEICGEAFLWEHEWHCYQIAF